MIEFLRDRLHLIIFVAVIFILGICFGSYAVKTVEYSVKENILNYFNDFMKGYNEIEYNQKSLMSESVKFNTISILIIWALGISVFIMPLITLLVFFKGFILGFTVGFLINEYNFKGILIVLSSIFPQNVFIIPSYIFASVIAINFSIKIFKYYRGRERLNYEDFLAYTMEMAVFAGILVLASFFETYASPVIFRFVLRFI